MENKEREVSSRWLNRSIKRAKTVLGDLKQSEDILAKAGAKIEAQKSRLKDFKSDLELLREFVADWVRGRYRRVPAQTIFIAFGALIYFLNPFDMVTDFLPVWGFLDDATLIALAIKGIRNDLEEYKVWKKHSTN